MSKIISEDWNSSAFDIPYEIQQLIFEYAARSDGRCARNLAHVARYVNTWILPVIYERVVVRGLLCAVRLLRTIRERPSGYFTPLVKSLALADDILLPLAEPILAELSPSILFYTILRKSDYPYPFLECLRSPDLRHMSLVYKGVSSSTQYSWATPYEIPTEVISSLTHLVIVVDYPHGPWQTLSSALQIYGKPSITSSTIPFENLTYFATSYVQWCAMLPVRKVADRLRCFAILEPRRMNPVARGEVLAKLRGLDDRRCVLLSEYGDPQDWSLDDGFTPSEFWTRVENLVCGGYLTDQGERW